MNYEITGHCALVTGSSRGIGSAVALELARAGADVIIHGSKPSEKADAVCAEIKAMGRDSCVIPADLSVPEQVQILGRQVASLGADILVLDASMQINKHWEDITADDYTVQMNCNFLASLLLLQALVPGMKKKNWGRVVAIGSVQEKKPHPDMLIYSASKCAQNGLVMSLAPQLAPFGITVNDVAPGVVYTDRNIDALKDPEYAAYVISTIPAGFYGQKEDLAGIVRLLCSDAGRYITGQTIYVDGGKGL